MVERVDAHPKLKSRAGPYYYSWSGVSAFYRKYLRGAEINRPRWKRCVNLVDRNLGEALGKVYVDKMFSPTMKERTVAMTQAIEREMEAHLKQLPWMSAATKHKALEKLHTVANPVARSDSRPPADARQPAAGTMRRTACRRDCCGPGR